MSSDTDLDEFSRYCVDGDIVAAMKSTLQFDDEISRTA
jgi:copper homeostasis protein